MSHYTVIVALKNPEGLAEALAPFDENIEVEAYREHEDGAPAEHWIYSMLQRRAEDHENGTGILPYEPDAIGWSSASSKKTPEKQAEEIAREAALFHSLPNPPEWADVVRASDVLFGDEGELEYDPDQKRAFTTRTYNPLSKWDWYQVGGRWSGYFKVKKGANRAEITNGEGGVFNSRNTDVTRCDAGSKANLDLEGMRDEKGAEAAVAYDIYHELVDGLPEALPWSHFRGLAEADDYTIDQARTDYHAQARVQAIKGTQFDRLFGDDLVETYAQSRQVVIEQARARAVPGYAVLTLDGRWMSPGEMGLFGMSSENKDDYLEYLEVANAYLNSLPDDTWLAIVDCHI